MSDCKLGQARCSSSHSPSLSPGCRFLPDAQQPANVPRIGYLSPASDTPLLQAFRQGLRDLGWVEGHNIALEVRSADGKYERLPQLAAELVRLNVARDRRLEHPGGPGGPARHHDDPDRHTVCGRSDRERARRQPGASGGQHHGVDAPGSGVAREVCGVGQGSRPRSHSDWCPLEPGQPNTRSELEGCRSRGPGAQGSASRRGGADPEKLEIAFSVLARKLVEALVVLPDGMFLTQGDRIVALASEESASGDLRHDGVREGRRSHGLWGQFASTCTDTERRSWIRS